MSTINSIQIKKKFKHLTIENYEFIINSMIAFEAEHKNKKRNIGKTQFIESIAATVGTSRSNIYEVLNDSRITILDTNLNSHYEYSALAGFNKRSKNHKIPNNCKLEKAKPFIELIENEVLSNKLSSIDETVNYLKLHEHELIKDYETVCTSTIYSYIHNGLIKIKPIDLPRMVQRKNPKNKYKTYIPGSERGKPISERPFEMSDRSEFGHWEGDLVTGPRDGKNGAYLTLIERKTRFYYMIPIKEKTSKRVLMKINELNRFYGDDFSSVFKSITFDNGSEFARWKDIEKKPNTSKERTIVYFGRPYHSSDRGSNENCNGLIRYFVKKGTDINTIPKEKTIEINDKINNKKRKILGYLPAEHLFVNELNNLGIFENTIFYKSN